MKPLSMSATLQVIHPTPPEDAIWNAVEIAMEHGWTPYQFKHEVANAWAEALRRDAEAADKVLRK